jgi:hypothetical protein
MPAAEMVRPKCMLAMRLSLERNLGPKFPAAAVSRHWQCKDVQTMFSQVTASSTFLKHIRSTLARSPALNSAIARWYCAPPNNRICALGSASMICSGWLSGPMKAPPRMCSSANVSPKRSGGAATVPLSSSCSLLRKASRKMRPFSCSSPAGQVFKAGCYNPCQNSRRGGEVISRSVVPTSYATVRDLSTPDVHVVSTATSLPLPVTHHTWHYCPILNIFKPAPHHHQKKWKASVQ